MKKLYVVTVETEIVVVADDEADAVDAARDASIDFDLDYAAAPMRFLPWGWDGGEIPFGDADEERTVDEWIAAGAAPELTKRMAAKKAQRATEPSGKSQEGT